MKHYLYIMHLLFHRVQTLFQIMHVLFDTMHTLFHPRGKGAKRRSGRKPGLRVTNFALAEFKALSFTNISGGVAWHEKVSPKRWQILAFANAIWFLSLQVFITD